MKRYIVAATSPYDYNQNQTAVGSTLKTLKGSAIKRSKYGVGKEIGGDLYVHKNYADECIPHNLLVAAIDMLNTDYPDFQYNTIKYSPAKQTIAFQECPDFDTAREPVVSDYIIVDLIHNICKLGHSNYIFHHKWLWVSNDYAGFDVAESWNWSKQWLSILTEPSDGNGIDRWNAQLAKFGLS